MFYFSVDYTHDGRANIAKQGCKRLLGKSGHKPQRCCINRMLKGENQMSTHLRVRYTGVYISSNHKQEPLPPARRRPRQKRFWPGAPAMWALIHTLTKPSLNIHLPAISHRLIPQEVHEHTDNRVTVANCSSAEALVTS